MLSDMLGLEEADQRGSHLIAKQSTTIMRLEAGARRGAKTVEKEQRTLSKMNIGLQSLLRAFSFSQVEAKTTMIKAATEIQTELDDAGVKDDKPDALRGFMRNIFGKKGERGGVRSADVALDAVLAILKPERTNSANKDKDRSTSRASKKEMLSESMKQAIFRFPVRPPLRLRRNAAAPSMRTTRTTTTTPRPTRRKLRRRMDDIKLEMVAVAEQMAEMERRLLAQQADLERLMFAISSRRAFRPAGRDSTISSLRRRMTTASSRR